MGKRQSQPVGVENEQADAGRDGRTCQEARSGSFRRERGQEFAFFPYS